MNSNPHNYIISFSTQSVSALNLSDSPVFNKANSKIPDRSKVIITSITVTQSNLNISGIKDAAAANPDTFTISKSKIRP